MAYLTMIVIGGLIGWMLGYLIGGIAVLIHNCKEKWNERRSKRSRYRT